MNLWNLSKKLYRISESIPIKQEERRYSFSEVCSQVRKMLDVYTESQIYEVGLGTQLRKNQEEHRRTISSCIRTCCAGNYGAKEAVKEIIKKYLAEDLNISFHQLRWLLEIEEPEKMSVWNMLELLIYTEETAEPDRGFEALCNRYQWYKNNRITREQIYEAYQQIPNPIGKETCLNVLTQLVYAKTVGLGVVDTLNQQKGCIEEIQLGMTGKTELHYDYREEVSGTKGQDFFSRDGVHILVYGTTIWIPQLSFETEEELKRVLRNLIKETQAGELTQSSPMIVVDTVDGRRISVSRPPMTDAWVGLIRKFDTVREVSLENLYQEEQGAQDVIRILKWLVKSGRNIAITGEMASGKTTLFRACLAQVRPDRNIRVIEVDSFELNVRGFLPTANTMTMRVTEQVSAEEVLAFARKTTGQIFAVGEVNSAAVAAMTMDLSKIASQLLFSAHYVTTEHMIADFVNAKLCIGGYSEERLAQMDVVRSMGFDIHLRSAHGKRYIQCINEVLPANGVQPYTIRTIYLYDETEKRGKLIQKPGKLTYDRARQELTEEEYEGFCRFFQCTEEAFECNRGNKEELHKDIRTS